MTPKSHLLQNDGHGKFSDVTTAVASALSTAGMVTSATWFDYDRDGKQDLVVVGEWMPVRVFHQENGKLVERTTEVGFANTEGWWNTVTASDLDGDGNVDLVLGNLGLNSYITASAKEPAQLYVNDFLKNGTLEQILTFHKHGVSYPLAGRDELVKLLPVLRPKYLTYASFGASRIEDIFPAEDLQKASVLTARTFATVVARNNGRGAFTLEALPIEAQFAPTHAIVVRDVDGDGTLDLLLGGNFSRVPPVQGRYDAGYGLLLRGTGGGHFAAVDQATTALHMEGDVKQMRLLSIGSRGTLVLVARNNQPLQALRLPH